jgi:membrane associated rhomboid family serine protease
MFPVADDNPTHRVPILTIGLILLNVLVFLYQSSKPEPTLLAPGTQAEFVCEFGVIPDRLPDNASDSNDPGEQVCTQINARHPRALSLVTSQFLHAGWLHLLGNMLFLWIFGNNIEDRLGRVRYIPFYLLCGVFAAIGQTLTDPTSGVPMIGASGAIAGILGAYLLLYPRAGVRTFPLVFLRLPAWLVLGLWFALQFLYLGGESQEGQGGVAYWAHVVGFVAGLALIRPFLAGRPPPGRRRPTIEFIRP